MAGKTGGGICANPAQTLPLSNKAAAGIKAFYFHDPDGHNLEIIYFPPGKGDPRWQAKPNQVFLGIDHTAIGISNTERSLQFWSSQLGLLKKGESHNLGTEQAHLNNIAGAELRITGLRAPEGAGVEFLEYLRPGPGKAYPADTRCDDLWNWLTLAYCDDAEALFKLLRTQNVSLVSSQVVQTTRGKEFIARDPDGHAVWFVQRRP
jgi:catechol 2,3-dioxygenase-like lactoylglutathione lyase family enzyme